MNQETTMGATSLDNRPALYQWAAPCCSTLSFSIRELWAFEIVRNLWERILLQILPQTGTSLWCSLWCMVDSYHCAGRWRAAQKQNIYVSRWWDSASASRIWPILLWLLSTIFAFAGGEPNNIKNNHATFKGIGQNWQAHTVCEGAKGRLRRTLHHSVTFLIFVAG